MESLYLFDDHNCERDFGNYDDTDIYITTKLCQRFHSGSSGHETNDFDNVFGILLNDIATLLEN